MDFVKSAILIVAACFCVQVGSAQTILPRDSKKVHHVVFDVNVTGTIAYDEILNGVANLKKAFAPDEVRVEVVCHAAGIDMLILSKIKPQSLERMRKLNAGGVVFAACNNTMRGMHLTTSSIVPFAKVVDSGLAEVVRKEEAGWSYIKGAY